MLKLTKQDLFNKAYLGLKSQNWEKCTDENEKTVLVNKEGHRCGLGWCVTDDEIIEYGNILNIMDRLYFYIDSGFIFDVIMKHDFAEGDMKKRFDGLAEDYKLSIPND